MTTTAAPYQLMDTDSASLLGSYDSEQDALRAVAAAARKYGSDSEAVLNLILFREDVPADQAFIAKGADLVRQALAAVKTDSATTANSSTGRSGTTNGATPDAQADYPKGTRATT